MAIKLAFQIKFEQNITRETEIVLNVYTKFHEILSDSLF